MISSLFALFLLVKKRIISDGQAKPVPIDSPSAPDVTSFYTLYKPVCVPNGHQLTKQYKLIILCLEKLADNCSNGSFNTVQQHLFRFAVLRKMVRTDTTR